MGVEIPGLIAKENDSKQKHRENYAAFNQALPKDKNQIKNEAENQLQYLAKTGSISQQQLNTALGDLINNPNGLTGNAWDWNDYTKNVPQIAPYKQPYDPFGSGAKYPQPYQNPKVNIPLDEDLLREMKNFKSKPQKSEFELLIENLFSQEEKEQLLIDMGYELENAPVDARGYVSTAPIIIKRKLADGTYKTITNSLDDLFLKEITVKFKNLLLAKATLKIKF
jgi:hypothetical protein